MSKSWISKPASSFLQHRIEFINDEELNIIYGDIIKADDELRIFTVEWFDGKISRVSQDSAFINNIV